MEALDKYKEVTMKSHENKILIGAHTSISGGYYKAIEQGAEIGCTTVQIFTKSSRSWSGPAITKDDATKFQEAIKTAGMNPKTIVSHSSYLINIGSGNQETAQKSTNGLLLEVDRCATLGIPCLIVHPGSHVGQGEEKCIAQIAHNLDIILQDSDDSVTILLETMAGQGTNVGYTFESLKEIRSLCSKKKRIGFCLDTCHIFAAGYDISTPEGYKETMARADKILGLNHIKAIHLNDSKTPCNSRVDRHEAIGMGHIGKNTFKLIMNDKRFVDIPKILETPTDNELKLWKKEIKMLKDMVD